MTDFHSHTLPGIDDGSKNADQSLKMLSALYDMGFGKIMMTPHYYPDEQSISSFSEKRDSAFETLKSFAAEKGVLLPPLGFGSEVYLNSLLFSSNDDDIQKLTVDGNGKTILAEMEYTDALTDMTVNTLNRIIYNLGLTPVLAHIERYPFMNDERNVLKLLEMGCLCQINVTSLNSRFRRRKLIKYIHKGYICAIGSDIHSPLTIEEVKSGLSELSEKERLIINHEGKKMTNSSNIHNFFD